MATAIDIAPEYIGAPNIVLQLAKALETPLAQRPVVINVSVVNEALVSGLMLPLELRISAPSASGFQTHLFTRLIPESFAFTPREGGQHLITLREVGHNRWGGALLCAVIGPDAFDG